MTKEEKKEKARAYYQKNKELIKAMVNKRYHETKQLKGRANLGSKTKKLWEDPEYRKRMSEAHKGNKGYWEGKEIPQYAKDKMRDSKLEKPTRYWLNKKCNHSAGEKNPGYIHGNHPEHKRQRHTMEYNKWRRKVFERDNFTCQECGHRGVKLNADHIKPFAFFPELRFELTNGRTLCEPCHRKTPTYGRGSYSFKHQQNAA